MDKRTEREKMLDRFLNGFHPPMTDEQLAAFKAVGDRASTILLRDPYYCMVTTPAPRRNWLLYPWGKNPKERNMDNNKGLYHKFDVTVHRTGAKIEDGKAFVLLPEKDQAAAIALMQYAHEVRPEAPELASDIMKWLTTIELGELKKAMVPDWAKDFFANGMRSTTNGSGQDLVLIEAGPGRGKTTLGIIAGIKYWESHATYPPTTGMGFIVTLSFGQARDVIVPLLVDKFHGVVTCRHENIVSIPTKIGPCTIRCCAIDSPVLEGLHLHADWLFFDNLDLMHPQTNVWRNADRFNPKMLIFSQSVHTFASSILANKNEWNVLTDPTLL